MTDFLPGAPRREEAVVRHGLRTLSYGAGPTVLWIHGYTMDSTLWRPLWELLPGHRHLGVDLPGHGGSEPMAPGQSLEALAGRLAALAGEERARDWVGLSFGSTVAIQMAMDHPDLVRRLVLAAPTPAGGPPDPAARRRYIELLALRRIGGTEVGGRLAALWMQAPPDIFRGTERHPELRARLRGVIARHSWAELDNGAMAVIASARHTPAGLARITADTLVLTGAEDMPAFHANGELLAGTLPRCRLRTVPETGHLPLLENPQAVAAALAAHLSSGFDGAQPDDGIRAGRMR